MSNQSDRIPTLVGDMSIKNPVACAATTNIALTGEQTIDGVTTSGSRVLLTGQTDATTNGIYVSDTGTWERDADCDGPRQLTKGTLINVNGGNSNVGFWYCTTTGTIVADGSMAINFGRASGTLAIFSAFWQGVIGLATAALSRTALGAAASGANTDITSLSAPVLGAATATTAAAADSSTKVATTAFGQGEFVNKNTTRTANTVLAGPTTGSPAAPTFRALTAADLTAAHTVVTSALLADIALNNASNYFDGPSANAGTTGVWWVTATVTMSGDSSGDYYAKLWDGTTVIASGGQSAGTSSPFPVAITLSGVITNPAANLKISVKETNGTTGSIKFNLTGTSKDSTITAVRLG